MTWEEERTNSMAPRALFTWFLGATFALFLVGCLPADDGGFNITADRGPVGGLDDLDADDPADPDDDGDQESDPDDGLGWDPMQPQSVEPGTILIWTINCGMLDGSGMNAWEWLGDRWEGFRGEDLEEDLSSSGGGYPYEELEPCFRPTSNTSMEWRDDGTIHFFNGDWHHDMRPSTTHNRWMGTVYPTFEVSEACHEAMEGLGLSIPVNLSIEIEEFYDPTA